MLHCWHSGLTRQHEPPHQHHVPGVLAHICWWLQRLQQGRGSCLLKQKPQGRQLPGRHYGEVDPLLQDKRGAVMVGPSGMIPRLPHPLGHKTKFPPGFEKSDPETCISCPRGFRVIVLPKGVSRAGHNSGVQAPAPSSLSPGSPAPAPPSNSRVLTSPIFCTRLSVVYPEYVVLSTAGSR